MYKRQVHTFGKAAVIRLEADAECINADGRDIAHIEIYLEDENGNLVMNASNELYVNVEGAGHLLVLENGNTLDHSVGRCAKRKAHYGLLLTVVQSNRNQPGMIHVEVSSEGLKTQTIDIVAK